MSKVTILGVKIDDTTLTEALARTEKWIWNPGKHYIVTPNPEIVVAAQKDVMFKKILNDADLSIPDGRGLKLSGKIKNTFSGTDFMEELVGLASEKGFTVGFLGGRDRVAEKTAECLKKKYPGLKVVFAESGGEMDVDGQWSGSFDHKAPRARSDRSLRVGFVPDNSSVINSVVRETAPVALIGSNFAIPPVDILFVAFGHIKQEKWIVANLKNIPAKIAMGVGGSFDYLSGTVPRAPKWMRDLSLEWLFRLVVQPWRIKRQLALLKYLWLIILRSN